MTSAENELRPGERVAWGPPPIAEPDRPKMRLLEWRSMVRNTLRGFCVIELPSGLVIRDVAVHEKAGKFWANLPARPMLDADGKRLLNHGGRRQFAPMLGWRTRELADAFSEKVVFLIRATHPDALNDAS